MRFSEKHGYRSARDAIQLESLDSRTRTRLANLIGMRVVQPAVRTWDDSNHIDVAARARGGDRFLFRLLDEELDSFVFHGTARISEIESAVQDRIINGEWFRVLDLIQFVSAAFFTGRERADKSLFENEVNDILAGECVGHRLVQDVVTPLTSKLELGAVDFAINSSAGSGAGLHLSRALELLSDREAPDYRNSIKESISAVEGACSAIAGQSSASLGRALKALERRARFVIHPALRSAFEKLYGYTSDEDGIRHALIDEDELAFEDAHFMLVVCSAFLNYIRAKEAGASGD